MRGLTAEEYDYLTALDSPERCHISELGEGPSLEGEHTRDVLVLQCRAYIFDCPHCDYYHIYATPSGRIAMRIHRMMMAGTVEV